MLLKGNVQMSLAENELKMAANFKHMFHQNEHTCTSVQNSTLGVQQIIKTSKHQLQNVLRT
jgi:hypothetical protein